MSSRGRGYASRGGSYGGRGGYPYRGTTSYRGSSTRGSYNDRGGRGGFSYGGSAERYNTSTERYGRNDRTEEMSFKKPYRSDGPSNYGAREHLRGGSPERKRMRIEESTGGRRSHDGGNHYGGRHESYSNERRSYIEQRRSPSRDNSYRKNASLTSPRSPPVPRSRGITRGVRSSALLRRSVRGRPIRSSRGSFRGSSRARSFKSTLSTRSFFQTRKVPIKVRSALKAKHGSATSSEAEENWDTEEKKVVKEDAVESPEKAPAKREEGEGDGEATDKEAADAASGDEQEALPTSKITGRSFIRLICPHCREKCLTFKIYTRHLQSLKHRRVMDDVALKLKFMLQRMRAVQRTAQRVLEDTDNVELSETALFCPLCKLNHRTSRQDHNRSECHRNIKKLLSPYCKICSLALRSPMLYEHHICSLEHIKSKARTDLKSPKVVKAKKSASGDEGMDVDLDNFMTLDSVGDIDEVDDDDSAGEKKTEGGTVEKKVEVNVGNEHVKKVEVFYCELCKNYLPRGDDDTVLRAHCRMRNHLSRYVRFRDDRTLRRQAERIHRIHQQAKENKTSKEKDAAVTEAAASETAAAAKPAVKENGAATTAAAAADEEGEDELLTDDVDKELGDLLREVNQPDKYSDDEDDSNVGRYDRFRKSDKKSEADNTDAAEVGALDSTNVKSEAETNASAAAEVVAK